MTAQILASELSIIISESKKKTADLRSSAEKSAQELKALPQTSESQIAADLRRRPQFPSPFLTACKSTNAKLALSGVTALQRLIVAQGLAADRLREALDALHECSKLGLDIQLKVLQALPSLLQNFSKFLEGDLQAKTFEICTTLQQVKSAPVSSTASATLQQVVSSVFEKLEKEDDRADEIPSIAELKVDGETVRLRTAAYDAYRILKDICLLLEGQKADFVRTTSLAQPFGLELIESVLTSNGDLFESHEELAQLLQTRIMPIVTRVLSERLNFGVTVRATRILCIVIKEHLHTAIDDVELSLGLLSHLLDADGPNNWRRALCMETYRLIYSAPNLATTLYSLFDEQEGRRNIIRDNLALFVRLAAEKPALIGIGNQSSAPVGGQTAKAALQEQAVLEANGIAGVITGDIGVSETSAPGISTQFSAMKPPCLEQLDKTEPPVIPETYVYSLVLTCMTALSDGLARVILPLTAPQSVKADATSTLSNTDKKRDLGNTTNSVATRDRSYSDARSHAIPANPRDLKTHKAHRRIETIASMVDTCWPPILATSSTFLNAALDSNHYRALIRSVQRFTQLAGLLRLATPRDAFMTTLAKSAVPSFLLQADTGVPGTPSAVSPRIGSGSEGFFVADSTAGRTHSRRASVDGTPASLSQRNLMCLRALINIAIALGTVLDEAWSIVVEALQRADSVLARSGNTASRDFRSPITGSEALNNEPTTESASLSTEVAAVESAIDRLFTSTGDYPHTAFIFILKSLCSLIGEHNTAPGPTALMPGAPMLPRRTNSLQTLATSQALQARSLQFALAKIGDLARTNIDRLCRDAEGGWAALMHALARVATGLSFDHTSRLMAADIRASAALGVTLATLGNETRVREVIQYRALGCLEDEVRALLETVERSHAAPSSTDFEVHRSAIEAVRSILEECGDGLVSGWRSIFAIVNSSFTTARLEMEEEDDASILSQDTANIAEINGKELLRPVSPRIARAAFECVQLICSDFLPTLKRSRVVMLIDILSYFCAQTAEMNISLTTLTLFWKLSDHLGADIDTGSDQELSNIRGTDLERSIVRTKAEGGSPRAMWMLLQLRLADMTEDPRSDVSIGAIQTIFRILGSHADRLADDLWEYTFREVFLRMLRINLGRYSSSSLLTDNASLRRSIYLTSKALLGSFADFMNSHRHRFVALSCSLTLWQAMLELLEDHIKVDDVELRALLYECLSSMLPSPQSTDQLPSQAVDMVTKIWIRTSSNPKATCSPDVLDLALLAYVRLGTHVHSLAGARLTKADLEAVVARLEHCIDICPLPPYTSDVETMTSLQAATLDLLLKLDGPDLSSTVIKQLASFAKLPYRTSTTDRPKTGPTFVAFAKQAQASLSDIVATHAAGSAIYNSGAVALAYHALATAVSMRYQDSKQGKNSPLWQSAASTASSLCTHVLPLRSEITSDDVKNEIWSALVELTSQIRESDINRLPSEDDLINDETFDLKVLAETRRAFGIILGKSDRDSKAILGLDDASIEQQFRAAYASSLFRASLFHEHGFTMPNDLLQDLYTTRPGRVYDPPFHPRIRICYASLDEMFALVDPSLNGISITSQSSLSKTLMPYIILRCALPLKRYIADQPLRGKMPTPMSQRLELLYLLKMMKRLERMHLYKLLPLVGKASVYARFDPEVAEAMQNVLALSWQSLEAV